MEKVRLKELARSGNRSLDTEDHFEFPDLPLKGNAHVVAHVKLNETGCQVSGHFEAVVEEPCDRCAEPYEREVHDQFDERYIYDHYGEEYGGGERELDLDETFEVLPPDAELDLKDLVYQHLVMKISSDRFCNSPECEIRIPSQAS